MAGMQGGAARRAGPPLRKSTESQSEHRLQACHTLFSARCILSLVAGCESGYSSQRTQLLIVQALECLSWIPRDSRQGPAVQPRHMADGLALVERPKVTYRAGDAGPPRPKLHPLRRRHAYRGTRCGGRLEHFETPGAA